MSTKNEAIGLHADYIISGEHVTQPPVNQVPSSDYRSEYYERPMGFYSEDLRSRFTESSVRIGGVGGGGGMLAVMLAKEGVCDFSIADVEQVEPSNVGRIPIYTPDDVGREKVDVVADLITRHNKSAIVRVYKEGIQKYNVEEFVGLDAGNKGITVAFDEIELNEPAIGRIFHQSARKYGRFVIAATDVERGGMVTTFDPHNMRHTFEHYMGTGPEVSDEAYLKKVKGFQLPTIPNIPKTAAFSTLKATMVDGASLPTTLQSVLVATGLALDEFEKLLTRDDPRYPNPHMYPYIHAVNPSMGEDFVTRYPRLRCLSRITKVCVRSALGLNPDAGYGKSERLGREAYRLQKSAQL